VTALADLAIAGLLELNEPLRLAQGQVGFRGAVTGGSETPLPAGVHPTTLIDPGTLAHALAPHDAGDLAREASRYARALAVISVDPQLDAEVDALVESRVQGTRVKRPLRKR
jgi:hypothetical protein